MDARTTLWRVGTFFLACMLLASFAGCDVFTAPPAPEWPGPTHRILFPATFRIEPNDVVWARYMRARSVSIANQPHSNVGRNRPCGFARERILPRLGDRHRLNVL